ncbi:hypothetical protein N0V94_008412 [Neodidymelliopsis sp. IMI 364377]|nr:hypothetical protein N0V94_008412 [Neodidymelliopsis sp. IMI 364377]
MAPVSADAARPVQKQQARRPLSRIVPAIPHRLSRPVPAARPMTPEHSHKGAVTQKKEEPAPELEPEPQQPQQPQEPQQPVQTPLTPDSKTSAAEKTGTEVQVEAPALASSPAKVHDVRGVHSQQVELPAQAQAHVSPANDESNHVQHVPLAADPDTKPLTNGVHRKELPPPFYPSNLSATPTPVAENPNNIFHPARPSVDGAMASMIQDSPAQPATLHDYDYDYDAAGHAHRQSVPRIPPGFAPPNFTPSFFPGHSHHPSEAGAPWLYPPFSMPPPPEPIYGNGTEFQSPPFTTAPSTFPEPFQGHFSPEETRFATNGVATSHSQSPSKSHRGEPLPVTDRADVQHALPQQNGLPRTDQMNESPFELASYLSTQFGNPEFADFILQVRSPEFQYISIPVHGIVVVRSPVFANAVRRSIPPAHRSKDSRRLVDVLTTNLFVAAESIEEAVKVLYGAPLLSMQSFLYGLGPYTPEAPHPQGMNDARRRMEQLLSYIGAGSVLQIPSMQARGVEIAKALLRWDTVEQALHYGLQAARSVSRANNDGSEGHDPFASELLNSAIDFIAYNFPNDFHLYRIASELQDDPRLPSVAESRAPTHNSRLSKIRFGDAPMEDEPQPSPISRMLSSILLSLPLPLVDRLFNHRATANQIGWTGVAKLMHNVVDEREDRRQKAVQGQLQLDGTTPSVLLENLYVEERVDHVGASPLHPSGYMLSANRSTGQV